MNTRDNNNLGRLSLIRDVYRSLINTGRSYAAFEKIHVMPLVHDLADRGEILDPMSGYGSLMLYCAEIGKHAYCVEFGLPLYLWQLLNHPRHAPVLCASIEALLLNRKRWPRAALDAAASDEWFTEESLRIIGSLFRLTSRLVDSTVPAGSLREKLAASLLCPFVGRLSCSIPGSIAQHVKEGGICIYRGWRDDYEQYLRVLYRRLRETREASQSIKHTVLLGDCRKKRLPSQRFGAMITSPPYPNHRDLTSTFAPENRALSWLADQRIISFRPSTNHAIGSIHVSKRERRTVRTAVARRFLAAIEGWKGSKKAKYDNDVYYLPYYTHYFADLELAYENVARALSTPFKGYIVVVNNTARDQVIPVAEAVMEIWRENGFSADIEGQEERHHVGTKNPRARGLKAKHTRYTIRITRS